MSELKWNWVYYPYLDAPNEQEESALKAGYIKVVIKDEADKVIAEKDKEIQRLENLCESYRIDCDNLAIREANAYKEIERDNKQIRHQKHSRRRSEKLPHPPRTNTRAAALRADSAGGIRTPDGGEQATQGRAETARDNATQGGKMTAKLKEAFLWAMAIAFTTAIVVAFWGGIAVVVMGVVHYLGGE